MLNEVSWPVTLVHLVSVPGLAILASVIALWYKRYLDDNRWVPLLILASVELVGILAQVLYTWPWADWIEAVTALLVAFVLGLIAASLAVFGYEVIINQLGMAGIGPRADTKT